MNVRALLLGLLFFANGGVASHASTIDPMVGSGRIGLKNCTGQDMEVLFSQVENGPTRSYQLKSGAFPEVQFCPPSCWLTVETFGQPSFTLRVEPQKRYTIRADDAKQRWIVEPITPGSRPRC